MTAPSIVSKYPLCVHAGDRQTDGRTDVRMDRLMTPKTALAYARAVKTRGGLPIRHNELFSLSLTVETL